MYMYFDQLASNSNDRLKIFCIFRKINKFTTNDRSLKTKKNHNLSLSKRLSLNIRKKAFLREEDNVDDIRARCYLCAFRVTEGDLCPSCSCHVSVQLLAVFVGGGWGWISERVSEMGAICANRENRHF
jgi:hypothetical protein